MSYIIPVENRTLAPSWRRHWPAVLVIFFGVGFSLAVFFALRYWEYRDIEMVFRNGAADRTVAVKKAFETPFSMLKLVQSAFEATGQLPRKEFHELLKPFHEQMRSIVAVEWVPSVSDDRRQEIEDAARRDGLEGYQITELDANGQIVRAAKRDRYFPVYYSGPAEGNPIVFGYDLASEAVRRQAMLDARDSGKITASGQIAFIQEPAAKNCFLLLLPIYEKGKPIDTLGDRRRYFQGTIVGVFRPDVMIESALEPLKPLEIDMYVVDSTASRDKLYYVHSSRTRNLSIDGPAPAQIDERQSLLYRSKFDMAGYSWSIECAATPQFIAIRREIWPWAALAVGMTFTAMLAAYFMSSIDRRAFAERLIHEKRMYARGLETKVHERTEDLRLAQEEVIQRLVSASLWRDQETGMHIRRTGLFAELLAKAAGWSAAEAEILRLAAPMHDVGKIGIPDSVLRKPGKLTREEHDVIKMHTLIGGEMLVGSKVPILQMAHEVAMNHHEWWDGTGYPARIMGLNIPESARIVAIVDVFDALSHDRVYRKAYPEDEVVQIMQRQSGTHFDPSLMALFLLILPEFTQINREHPDETREDMSLIRTFASAIARSNATEVEAALTISGNVS